MCLSPVAALVAACALTFALTACDDEPENSGSDKARSSSESASGSEGGETKDNSPNDGRPGTDICVALDEGEVGEIFRSDLKKGELASGSCSFNNSEVRSGVTVGIAQSQQSASGGFEASQQLLGSYAKGKPEKLDDVGDEAVLVIGKGMLGKVASAALLSFGDELVQVNVVPVSKVNKKELKEQTIELLRLIDGKF